MNPREFTEQMEREHLSPYACLSTETRGRAREEEPCEIRTCFQRDRDRILHSKSFRRLKHKTQVFLTPEQDHYRTRLTHTLEVSQIARTLACALRLNEPLTEAMALGHDLGHTPFGHAGERVLNRIYPGGFRHNEQSLRVVEVLENDYKGLNLTLEVRDGIAHHTGQEKAFTLEGQLIQFADRIAYINHDIDDAIRGGILFPEDIPYDITYVLGRTHSQRIDTMIKAVLSASTGQTVIDMEPEIKEASLRLRSFLFASVYTNPAAKGEEGKAEDILERLYHYFVENPKKLPEEFARQMEREPVERVVCDYLAGMTDRYAMRIYQELFLPKAWQG